MIKKGLADKMFHHIRNSRLIAPGIPEAFFHEITKQCVKIDIPLRIIMMYKKIFRSIAIIYIALAVLAFTLPAVLEFLNVLINCWNWRSIVNLYRCM
jgi:hypothetical protein